MGLRINKKTNTLIKARLSKRKTKVVIPYGITCIGKNAFSDCEYLEEIILPETIERIDNFAFFNCKNLSKINLPNSINYLGENVFARCRSLKSINLPNSLGYINKCVFEGCESLENVVIPSSVKYIDKNAFCATKIKNIDIPSSITTIGDFAFSNCVSLEKIELTNSIRELGKGVFYNCRNLGKVKLSESIKCLRGVTFKGCAKLGEIFLPDMLENIEGESFCGCLSLTNVVIPNKVKAIEIGVFDGCKNLEEISLPIGLKRIDFKAFKDCISLKTINIPDSVDEIGTNAFDNCVNLEKIELPSTIKTINIGAFSNCHSLKEIRLPLGLEMIERRLFEGCRNLEKIEISNDVKTIEYRAFLGCRNLKTISIPKSVKNVTGSAFSLCKNLQNIHLGSFHLLNEDGISEIVNKRYNFYFNENTEEMIVSRDFESIGTGFKRIDYDNYSLFSWSIPNSVALTIVFGKTKLNKIGNFRHLLPLIYNNCLMYNDSYKELGCKLYNNSKEFNVLIRELSKQFYNIDSGFKDVLEEYFSIFKFAYCLGAFDDVKKNRQKACEFIINVFDKKILEFDDVIEIFEEIKELEYKEEWASFIMLKDNFFRLCNMKMADEWVVSLTYNYFDEIREFGKTNRGNSHYRKVTIEMCEECLAKVSFKGINKENEDIAEEISKYTRSQNSFDVASKIREEYLKLKESGKIKDHILDEEVKEDIFSEIETVKSNTFKDIALTLMNLGKTVNEIFTYELLSKYDASNFVLGKYCNCCAHLEGAGFSIMKAGIIHPDCQNIVIRNKDGNIISKSILYLNREEGYCVLNTIAVNEDIGEESKNIIFEKYLEVLDCFAKKYNEANPLKPIKQINVGIDLNDLDGQIIKMCKKSNVILKGLDFSKYGDYIGDWKDGQYVMWNDKIKRR